MLEGIEAIVFRTIGDRPSSWESRLPPEVLRLPEELARVDALLRLAGAVLVDAHDEWQVSDRRYLSEGSMALLSQRPGGGARPAAAGIDCQC